MRSGIDSIDVVLKLHSAIRKNFPPCFHSLIPGVIEVWEHQERKPLFLAWARTTQAECGPQQLGASALTEQHHHAHNVPVCHLLSDSETFISLTIVINSMPF